ncbi:MAG: hypothetical protein OXC62_13625 [Aestuariivita sp.]|nr:hypothetical protein [Aestuariivita sp.]
MPILARAIGIDHFRTQKPIASLKGLRAYMAEGGGQLVEVPSSLSLRKYLIRNGVAN